jgi:hypothetical protein
MLLFYIVLKKGVRKGEEFKAPHYTSAAAIRDYITTRDIIPNIMVQLSCIYGHEIYIVSYAYINGDYLFVLK